MKAEKSRIRGGIGYARHKPFKHIYRHHCRYRITGGAEEIQMRKAAAFLFGYMGPRKGKIEEPTPASRSGDKEPT